MTPRLCAKHRKYLSDALDPIADAEIHDDPADDITPEYRPYDAADLIYARRHSKKSYANKIKKNMKTYIGNKGIVTVSYRNEISLLKELVFWSCNG